MRYVPVVGQQLAESSNRVLRDTREHVTEPGEGLNTAAFAGRDEALQNRCSLTAVITAEERPVAAADRDRAVGPLGRAVVDLQLAVLQKASQRLPLIQSVTHGRAGRALGQDFLLQVRASTFPAWR